MFWKSHGSCACVVELSRWSKASRLVSPLSQNSTCGIASGGRRRGRRRRTGPSRHHRRRCPAPAATKDAPPSAATKDAPPYINGGNNLASVIFLVEGLPSHNVQWQYRYSRFVFLPVSWPRCHSPCASFERVGPHPTAPQPLCQNSTRNSLKPLLLRGCHLNALSFFGERVDSHSTHHDRESETHRSGRCGRARKG